MMLQLVKLLRLRNPGRPDRPEGESGPGILVLRHRNLLLPIGSIPPADTRQENQTELVPKPAPGRKARRRQESDHLRDSSGSEESCNSSGEEEGIVLRPRPVPAPRRQLPAMPAEPPDDVQQAPEFDLDDEGNGEDEL